MIFLSQPGIIRLNSRGQDYCAYVYFYLFDCLIEVYSVVFTDGFANTTLVFFQIEAALIDIGDKRNGLSKVNMDGFILRDSLVELIRILNRAVLYTGSTTRALALINVSGLLV